MKEINYLKLFWSLVGIVSFIFAIFLFKKIIFIFLLAFVLSSALNFYVSFLEKLQIPRALSLILIYLVFIVFLSFLIYLISHPVLAELKSLPLNIGPSLQKLSKENLPILNILPSKFFPNWSLWLSNLASSPSKILSFFFGILNNLTAFVFVFVLTFYLSLKPDGVENFASFFLTKKSSKKFSRIWKRVEKKIYRWFTAQIILSGLITLSSFLALRIIGIDYAVTLSLIAGLFEIIPIIGPIFAGTLAALIALKDSLTAALLVILAYIIIQQAESHLLVPNVMKKAVDFDPAVVLFLILGGASLGGGIIGIIIAIPLGVAFREILLETEK